LTLSAKKKGPTIEPERGQTATFVKREKGKEKRYGKKGGGESLRPGGCLRRGKSLSRNEYFEKEKIHLSL